MTSARRLYWVGLGFAALAAALLALAAALSALSLAPPPVAELVAACRRFLLPDVGLGAVVILSLASLGIAVVFLGARAVIRQLAAYRRFRRTLRPLDGVIIAGTPVTLIDQPRPEAFCAGYLRPHVYLSTGARDALTPEELEAVILHERHHLQRRDPLRISAIRTLAEALFFVPVLRRLAVRYTDFAELAADDAAIRARSAPALASALLAFELRGTSNVGVGISAERADHLLGSPPRWQLPVLLVAGSVVGIGSVLALAVQVALPTEQTLNLPQVFMQSCMVAMAAMPVLIAASALYVSRPLRSARRRFG